MRALTAVLKPRLIVAVLPVSAFIALSLLPGPRPAFALTKEAAVASCRNSVGTPIVRPCMQGGGSMDQCRAKAQPAMMACVTAALNRANGRANVAVGVGDTKARKEAVNLGNALPAGFVPPPRTIADITAVLDNEKPDPAAIAKLKQEAEAAPEKGASSADLAAFHYYRGSSLSLLGRQEEAIADGEKALGFARSAGDQMLFHRTTQFIGMQRQALGDLKGSLRTYQEMMRATNTMTMDLWHIIAIPGVMQAYLQAGDVQQADGLLRRLTAIMTKARTSGIPGHREQYRIKGRMFEAFYNTGQAVLLEARGQYREAEDAYRRAADYRRASVQDLDKFDNSTPPDQVLVNADSMLLNAARMKAKQGRLAEAEVDARAVLLTRLKAQGKYNPYTTKFVVGLAGVMVDQGRYADAEKLFRSALDIQRTVGIGDGSQTSAQVLSQLGAVLTFQRKTKEAAVAFAELDKAIAEWEAGRKQALELNGSRIMALYASGQIDAGLAAAQELVKLQVGRVGERHFDTAAARGTLAMGLALAGKDADAVREFKAAIPILMAAQRENADDDDDTVSAARSERLQGIVEAYIAVLAKGGDNGAGASLETFALADAIRGQSVQKALSASSARSVAKDPALAELVRKEQDFGKQVNAQLGALNNALASNARDENVIKATRATIDKLRADRQTVRDDINKRFPSYAELIDPKPPTVDQVKQALVHGEAMLSFYFGRTGSFVWAVPKDGQVAFAAINATSGDVESKVRKLREALEPNAAMISDIPAFDVTLGHELYSLLLKPVETGWKSSKSLIVVTNGALGLLPLSLLPTAPAQVKSDDEPLFASYRGVPWLARTHAVTMVPSSAALRTLRGLPPGKPERSELIAFGDPHFSKEQHDEAMKPVQVADVSGAAVAANTRGGPLKRRNAPKLEGVDSAELALLPRLPDTADELKSIALALEADPSKVLHLGKEANETKVKTTDLSGFKVLAFATHGLVPGELNGLTQPALALSAPAVSGAEGDGLLTMEEILSLKLDADWVVLSACNTGAGSGAGAEAASGLGRAFFYAGTRALLVTNWSVHSQSARELVTDLFKRQAADKHLTRGEALRQAMMAMVDGQGYADASGKTEFAYAHPLFWAPYTIIGDGGKR
jgi:CHAT domain-containing protein